jgi:hypothetical protein
MLANVAAIRQLLSIIIIKQQQQFLPNNVILEYVSQSQR